MPSSSLTHSRQQDDGYGYVYVVATPIGNMDDITIRALKTLHEVDLVAAEDTRRTGKLLTFHQINASLISYHEHNENERTAVLIDRVKNGESIALLTDAGTPSVSDPGYRLVKAAIESDIRVIPIPGASAVITALCASGLPTDAFIFVGFPARKKARRLKQLESLAAETRTLVIYESPRRICSFLKEVEMVMGERYAVLGREMTKLHEEFVRGSVSDIARTLAQRPSVKGECTLIISGAGDGEKISAETLKAEIRNALGNPGERPPGISKRLAVLFGLPRSRVYKEVMKVKAERKGPGGKEVDHGG